jgi:hypothetical protein
MPDSSLLTGPMIAIPKGVFFDTIAPALGVHYSKFGQRRGFSLTAGTVAKPNLDQLGKDWGKLVSIFGYLDIYYVKRISDTFDLGLGLTWAWDPFSARSEPGPAHLHFLESKNKPWLPTSRENVPPSEDRSGHRLMFKIQGTHDIFGR